jgi:hypothetical protein
VLLLAKRHDQSVSAVAVDSTPAVAATAGILEAEACSPLIAISLLVVILETFLRCAVSIVYGAVILWVPTGCRGDSG